MTFEVKKLPEICTIRTGKHDANHAEKDGKYRFYTCASQFSFCNTKSFEGECIIVPGNGDIGLVFYYNGEFDAYQRTYVLSDIKINAKYLYYHMVLNWRNANDKKKFGSTVKYVRLGNFTSYEIPVPPSDVQARIVERIEELFSQLDASVEELQTAKEKLKVYRQAVLKEAFEGKLTGSWRDENPENSLDAYWAEILSRKDEYHNTRNYRMEEEMFLPQLPDGWKWIHIGDITRGPEYGTSQKSLKTGAVPVIRMGNLQNGEIDWSDLVFTNDEEEIEKYRLEPDTVLFNRTNSAEHVGKTAIYRGGREAIFAGYLIRINQFDCINAEYLNYYMNSYIARSYGRKVKTDGVNQSNINGKKLCSYPFPLCTREEQDRVVYELESRLSFCDNIEQTVDAALLQAEALRKSILKQAFEGKL